MKYLIGALGYILGVSVGQLLVNHTHLPLRLAFIAAILVARVVIDAGTEWYEEQFG